MDNTPAHERMAAMDQLFYQCEYDAARRSNGIGIYLLDGAPDWEAVEYAFDRLSREILRLRQRVVPPLFGTGPAYWVVDPDFDLRYHVRRVELSAGTALRTVLDRLEIELMSPMDLERPLWYVTLFEGLEGGQSVLAMRGSHCIGDGLSGMKMQDILFDSSRRARRRPMPPAPAGERLSPAEAAAENRRALRGAAPRGLRNLAFAAGKFGGRLLRRPKATATELSEFARSLQKTTPKLEPSPLFSARSLSRRVTCIELSIADLKSAAHQGGGTVNDAYLAGIAGALRHYHETLGAPVDRLALGFPISTRAENGKVAGNQITIGMLELPVAEADPASRMRDIHAQIQSARGGAARFDILGAATQVFGYLPPAAVKRIMEAMPMPALSASNIPGPTQKLFLGGARVERMIGIGPVIGGVFLAGLTAHGDTGTVAVTYDPAAIQDGKLFHAGLEQGFAEVLALAPRTTTSHRDRATGSARKKRSRPARQG